MPAELPRAALEQHALGLDRQRRHGEGLAARGLKRIPRQPRHTNLPLDLRVVGLEVGIRDRPVGHTRARRHTEPRGLLELEFWKTPEIRGEVHAPAANHATVCGPSTFFRGLRLLRPHGVGLEVVIVRETRTIVHPDLVVLEVLLGEPRPLLEHDDGETRLREFASHHATGRARSHNHEVDFVAGQVFFHRRARTRLRAGVHVRMFRHDRSTRTANSTRTDP